MLQRFATKKSCQARACFLGPHRNTLIVIARRRQSRGGPDTFTSNPAFIYHGREKKILIH